MVALDVFAHAFGFDEKNDGAWFTLGKVTAVNGSKLSVLLGGSATPTQVESYCTAAVGDVVLVVVSKGQARAIAKRGNILSIPDSAVTDASQAPSANQYGSALHVTDQQGEQVGYLGLVHETDDDLWTQLGVTRDVNGSPAYNSLWLGLADDGTPTVYFGGSAAQQAWRDALGELNIRHNHIDNKQANNGISANTWPVDVRGIDKNGLPMSFFGEAVYTTGDVAAGIWSYNHDTTGAQVSTNYITVGSRKDGTRYFGVGDKAAFLTALGIGTVKELDVSSNVSVATSTNKSLGSLTLEAGKWVVEYGTSYSSASSGIACTFLFTSKDVGANAYWYRATCVQTAVSGSNTWHQGSTILNLTASTTVYLTVWHNTGSAKNCQGQMRAIKVG